MKDLLRRTISYLRANWRRLLVISLLAGLAVSSVFQFQINSVLARTLGTMAANNEALIQEMSAQNVVVAQITRERDDLENTVAQARQLFQQMVPVNQVLWCTDTPAGEMPAEYASIVVFAVQQVVNLLPPEAQPSRYCVDLVGIFGSPQTGELYIPVAREFPGGAEDRIIVYLEPVPGQPENLWVAGFYSVVMRELYLVPRETPAEQPPMGPPGDNTSK